MMSPNAHRNSAVDARPTRRRVATIVGGAVFGSVILGLAVNAINTETLVTNGFDRTFAALARPQQAAPLARSFTGVAGSEDFWLRAEGEPNLIKAVSVGQRLLLTANGASQELTITDVRTASEEATHIDTGRLGTKVLLITCLDQSSGVEQRLRLKIEGGKVVALPASDTPQGDNAAAAPHSARAL